MIFWKTFLNSIKLPNKQAMFKLNRTGMDITVIYMFILLFLVSLPTFIDQMKSTSMNWWFFLIYNFMFSYLPLTIVVFILLSIVAYLGTGMAKLLKRRLRFSLLWKMSAYLTTIPFLLYMLLSFFIPVSDNFIWLIILYTFILLIKIITVYPKRRNRKRKNQ